MIKFFSNTEAMCEISQVLFKVFSYTEAMCEISYVLFKVFSNTEATWEISRSLFEDKRLPSKQHIQTDIKYLSIHNQLLKRHVDLMANVGFQIYFFPLSIQVKVW